MRASENPGRFWNSGTPTGTLHPDAVSLRAQPSNARRLKHGGTSAVRAALGMLRDLAKPTLTIDKEFDFDPEILVRDPRDPGDVRLVLPLPRRPEGRGRRPRARASCRIERSDVVG
jgi:hypothetical protein